MLCFVAAISTLVYKTDEQDLHTDERNLQIKVNVAGDTSLSSFGTCLLVSGINEMSAFVGYMNVFG